MKNIDYFHVHSNICRIMSYMEYDMPLPITFIGTKDHKRSKRCLAAKMRHKELKDIVDKDLKPADCNSICGLRQEEKNAP